MTRLSDWRERRRVDAENRILKALAMDWDWHGGYDLSNATGMRSGRLYPALYRMLERGEIQDMWAELEPERRYRRRLYRLTRDTSRSIGR